MSLRFTISLSMGVSALAPSDELWRILQYLLRGHCRIEYLFEYHLRLHIHLGQHLHHTLQRVGAWRESVATHKGRTLVETHSKPLHWSTHRSVWLIAVDVGGRNMYIGA